MSGKIHLILPGLFDLPLQELAPELLTGQLPALNRILRLASTSANSAFTIDAILRRVLSLEPAVDHRVDSLPLAQAFVAPERRQSNRQLLFQAVNLRPDLHNAIIAPVPYDIDSSEDINNIINDLGCIFKVDCDISAIDKGLFLMDLKAFEAPRHYPHLLSVLGKPANPYIEQSREQLDWYKLLNEMQMFLHAHELNQDRERRGLLPINSLWFWGGGRLPAGFDSRLAWFCDDSLLNRFASSLNLTPASISDLGDLDNSSALAVIDLRLLEFLKTGVATELGDLLLDIELRLLQPLSDSMKANRKELRLYAGYELDLEIKPGAGLKFWRQARNLDSWIAATGDY